jgi:hypothetical protein
MSKFPAGLDTRQGVLGQVGNARDAEDRETSSERGSPEGRRRSSSCQSLDRSYLLINPKAGTFANAATTAQRAYSTLLECIDLP